MHGRRDFWVVDQTPEFERALRSARRLRVGTAVICAAVLSAMAGYGLHAFLNPRVAPAVQPAPPSRTSWIAAAPGIVEAKSGELNLNTSVPGRIVSVPVSVNDRVEAGQALVLLDDAAARAQLSAAESAAAAFLRERDARPATAGREALRSAEDAAYAAERTTAAARFDLDAARDGLRHGRISETTLVEARKRYANARDQLQRAKQTLADAMTKPGLPAPNRFEAALITARAKVSVAQVQMDNTRLRSPIAGDVLVLRAKIGESVEPSADDPLVVVGDRDAVRVKAEVDGRDVAKLKVGQSAYVRCDAFPDRQFDGKVAGLAPALSPSRMLPRGLRGKSDDEVLQATVEFDSAPPLRPGQRVDVFFRSGP